MRFEKAIVSYRSCVLFCGPRLLLEDFGSSSSSGPEQTADVGPQKTRCFRYDSGGLPSTLSKAHMTAKGARIPYVSLLIDVRQYIDGAFLTECYRFIEHTNADPQLKSRNWHVRGSPI